MEQPFDMSPTCKKHPGSPPSRLNKEKTSEKAMKNDNRQIRIILFIKITFFLANYMELSESTNLSVTEARIAGNRDLFTAENLFTKFCSNNGRQ